MFRFATCMAPKGELRAAGRSATAGWRATNAASSCDPIAVGARRTVRKPRPKGVMPFGLRRDATIKHSTLQDATDTLVATRRRDGANATDLLIDGLTLRSR